MPAQPVGDEDSVGYREFLQRAPFDAVNLDLTSSVASDLPLTAGSVIQAIGNILHAQINQRREPWLSFLTTPLGRRTGHGAPGPVGRHTHEPVRLPGRRTATGHVLLSFPIRPGGDPCGGRHGPHTARRQRTAR